MNNSELRALAVAANVIDHNEQAGWYEKGNLLEYGLHYPKNCAYIAAMDPTTTLALLDEIERLRTAAQAGLEALCLPCDRWNKQQTEIVNAAIAALEKEVKHD